MSDESQLVIEIWEAVRDVVSASKRQETATSIVRAFSESGGYEASDLFDVADEDNYLAVAYKEVYGDDDAPDYDGDEEDED